MESSKLRQCVRLWAVSALCWSGAVAMAQETPERPTSTPERRDELNDAERQIIQRLRERRQDGSGERQAQDRGEQREARRPAEPRRPGRPGQPGQPGRGPAFGGPGFGPPDLDGRGEGPRGGDAAERRMRLARDPVASAIAAVASAGQLAQVRGDEAAIDFFNSALKDAKNDAVKRAIRLQLIELHKKRGEQEKAFEHARALIREVPERLEGRGPGAGRGPAFGRGPAMGRGMFGAMRNMRGPRAGRDDRGRGPGMRDGAGFGRGRELGRGPGRGDMPQMIERMRDQMRQRMDSILREWRDNQEDNRPRPEARPQRERPEPRERENREN